MLVDAVEKLAAARGAASSWSMPATMRGDFFEKRGYVAQQRNTVSLGDEWLANTTMKKALGQQKGGAHGQA